MKYKTVDQQLDHFTVNVLQKKIVPYTRYRGYAEAGLFGLLYLLRRNKNECVVLSNFRKLAERIIQQRYDSVTDIPFLEWSDIGFVFYWDNIQLAAEKDDVG